MNWDTEEELLLLDLYDYSLRHSEAEKENAIMRLSLVLKGKASNEGSSSVDIYRSVTGLRVRLKQILFLASDGEAGLSGATPIDELFFETYRDTYSYFRSQALAAKKKHSCYYVGEEAVAVPETNQLHTSKGNDDCPQSLPVQDSQETIASDLESGSFSEELSELPDEEEVAEDHQEDLVSIGDQNPTASFLTSDVTYAERYQLDPGEYDDIPIDAFDLPVRVFNRLMGKRIKTLGALLRCSEGDLANIKGLGRNSLISVDHFIHDKAFSTSCVSEIHSNNDQKTNAKPNHSIVSYLKEHLEALEDGDFSTLADIGNTDDSSLAQYKRAVEVLGTDTVSMLLTRPEPFQEIILALSTFVNETDQYNNRLLQLQEKLNDIPKERWEQRARFYIQAYSSKDEVRAQLLSLCEGTDTTLQELARSTKLSDIGNFFAAESFLAWCSFDIRSEISSLSQTVFEKERTITVIKMRAEKNTLDKVGKKLNLTRERVRQIEVKTQRRFNAWISRHKLLLKICAIRDGDIVLTPTELEDYLQDLTHAVVYLLANVDNPSGYIYDQQADAFIIGELSLSERVFSAIENLPDYINSEKLDSIAKELGEEIDAPKELVVKAISESYSLTGNTYHRARLSLSVMYDGILKKFYPHGIHVYDSDAITEFRQHVIEEYGFSKMPENDRAVSARIASISILCGRGKYKARQASYIPKDLAQRIHEFILSSQSIVLMNSIFAEFEDELSMCGIDNRYYLHGVLRELFGDEFFFKRDYISKDGRSSGLYSEIVRYVKNAPFTVSKNELVRAFPGVTDIMFSFALDDKDIINYFGEYLHSSHLSLSHIEKRFLKEAVESLLKDNAPHHVKEIYDIVVQVRPDLINRNGISSSFSLFSVLSYLFSEEYQFSRPYIALDGVRIGRPFERLQELVNASDEITIAEITDFAKENHFAVQSILDLINSFSDTHLLKDAKTLTRVSSLGIEEAVLSEIEEAIQAEIGDSTVIIAELNCIHRFKNISCPWNEWLIYSMLKKWSTLLEVSTTSPQFRHATPVVARKGLLNVHLFEDLGDGSAIQVFQADDLDNIDQLISDYVLDEV